jgi:hypothetical protein
MAFPHYIDEEGYSESPVLEVYLCGWCATPLYEPLDQLWAEVEGAFYPCLTGIARPDLDAYFGRPAMRTAGFAARFPVRNPAAAVHFHTAPKRSRAPIMVWEPSFTAKAGPAPQVEPPPLSPSISILLPAAGASLYHLFRSVQSVVNQTYTNWELCVAYNDSAAALAEYIADLAKTDMRIRICDFGGASAATLPALALREASGEYTAVLGQTDELHPDALREAARARAAIAYTDEDCVDECGRFIRRTFKPGYDSELLLQHDYMGQLACVRTSAIRKAGGFRPEFGPAQSWDLLLRVAEAAAPGTIVHIPTPLYSRRLAPVPRRQAEVARVLESCIGRRGLRATVREGLAPEAMRMKPRMEEHARAAVFLRMGDGAQQWNAMLRSRLPRDVRFFEIGAAGVYPLDAPHGAPLLTLDETEAEIAVFINCPIDGVNHEFFEELIAQAQRPQCGLAGGMTSGYIGFSKLVRSVPNLVGDFFATRMSLLAEACGLASLGHDGMQEVCNKLTRLTVQKGLQILYTPYAVATVRNS